ncbi:MAG: MFS transporter, partial [Chitinophagaceae bacterium]|nr:MFS transporter [Chitinophagaceae bacterium]
QLQLSDAGLGGVLLALPVGQMSGMALSSYLVSRFGSKRMLTIGALLYPGSLVLLGVASAVWQLAAFLCVFGLCANLSNISVNTQGVGVERLYRRSIMASFHGLWSLAGLTGGLIGAFVVTRDMEPFTHFCIICGLAILLWLIAHRYVLPRDATQGAKRSIFVKPDKTILRLGLIAFACMVCEGAMFDWSGVYFEKVVGAPRDLVRLGYVAFMFTMAGGRFAADWLVNRFGIKRMIQASGLVIISGLMLAVFFPYLTTATAGFLLVGIGVSSVVPLVYSLAGKSATLHPGVALAAVSSIGFFGFLLGPPMIGFIAEAASLRVSFAVIGILGLGTTILAGKIKVA